MSRSHCLAQSLVLAGSKISHATAGATSTLEKDPPRGGDLELSTAVMPVVELPHEQWRRKRGLKPTVARMRDPVMLWLTSSILPLGLASGATPPAAAVPNVTAPRRGRQID